MSEFCQLQLTCANQKEADKVKNTLLVKHFVACVREAPVKSSFHWQGKIEAEEEILLIMESRIDLFEKIEAEVTKLHSYDTFVLTALPIGKVSEKARLWLQKETSVEEGLNG